MMKLLKTFVTLFVLLFGNAVSANWLPIGTVDYTWGPFHIYTITLYSENGEYQPNQRPLMLTLNYAKPVEGKNFAITLKKELSNIAPQIPAETQALWAEKLEQTLPDFQPKDLLNYIALDDTGYFVLNDTVLEPQFGKEFNQAFLDIWLSPQSSFKRLQSQLLGEHNTEEPSNYPTPPRQLEATPVEDESRDPQPLPSTPEILQSAPKSAEAS
ncbi:Chalcone isomerase-like [Pasteurella testudinis DSM 23072]|uniref:Chalcone isomerase-like n=1 Tax=Pasteurella testudinis DSM 23072 TaxID=1122938 RepID=A0A1W1UME0_9PAST|nr:chalcone isomerase family protein [Pasteurella testudinis]SMB82159.1 Chalcone isomerase-like [Pasteurella testudinis DSM 23072]SUB52353.1 transmembrane protein [Pasteurella testudinis]